MAVINGEMTPEETTIAENRGSSQAILDYLKDPRTSPRKPWAVGTSMSPASSAWAHPSMRWKRTATPNGSPPSTSTTPTSEQKKATLDKTELEAYVAIVTGAQPIDYFDTFVSEWKRLGGDAIAQEVQEYFAQ